MSEHLYLILVLAALSLPTQSLEFNTSSSSTNPRTSWVKTFVSESEGVPLNVGVIKYELQSTDSGSAARNTFTCTIKTVFGDGEPLHNSLWIAVHDRCSNRATIVTAFADLWVIVINPTHICDVKAPLAQQENIMVVAKSISGKFTKQSDAINGSCMCLINETFINNIQLYRKQITFRFTHCPFKIIWMSLVHRTYSAHLEGISFKESKLKNTFMHLTQPMSQFGHSVEQTC